MSSDLASLAWLTILAVVVITAALAIPLAPRVGWWRRRLDGPDVFDCGWRVLHGHVPGLASRWRHRQAHIDGGQLLWRRLPWWWQKVRLAPATVEPVVHRQRGMFDAVVLAPDAVIVPVTLPSGERLEMAVLPRELDRALAQLRQPTGP
jgi:hypothetical protein